ncbi:50S ribosomal protein L33 [Mesomycoplasma neurolyticum]|nr:50S ribosomal protein L33 [Mesomycoplasma neurolyticum]
MSKSKITLCCVDCRSKNYVTNKSKEERLIIKKYCKKCKTQVLHKEEK